MCNSPTAPISSQNSSQKPGAAARAAITGDIVSKDDAECVLGELRQLCREKSVLVDSMDLAICQAKALHEAKINLFTAKITQRAESLESWASFYRIGDGREEFLKKKSIQILHGTIGFRMGKPSLKLLCRQKWDMVLARLKDKWPQYVRVKEEPDKERILADCVGDNPTLAPREVSAMGAKVVQDEAFFYDFNQA